MVRVKDLSGEAVCHFGKDSFQLPACGFSFDRTDGPTKDGMSIDGVLPVDGAVWDCVLFKICEKIAEFWVSD